jgi:hypothetical protein
MLWLIAVFLTSAQAEAQQGYGMGSFRKPAQSAPAVSAPAAPSAPAAAIAVPARQRDFTESHTMQTAAYRLGHEFAVEAQIGSSVRPATQMSFGVGLSRLTGYLGYDVRFNTSSSDYGAIHTLAEPGESIDPPAASDPNSEANRPRSSDDPWGLTRVGVGVFTQVRLFRSDLPLLSGRVRFGLDYASATDQKNDLPFSGVLWSTEAGLHYQLSAQSPFSLGLSIQYSGGELLKGNAPNETDALRRLAVGWVSSSLTFAYWL